VLASELLREVASYVCVAACTMGSKPVWDRDHAAVGGNMVRLTAIGICFVAEHRTEWAYWIPHARYRLRPVALRGPSPATRSCAARVIPSFCAIIPAATMGRVSTLSSNASSRDRAAAF